MRQFSTRFFPGMLLAFVLFSFKGYSEDTRLLRSPAISGNKVCFEYGGDLWLSSLDGSKSFRLTVFEGVETDPVFSPDGQKIAFTAQYDGNTDVYIIPVTGGTPQRLTWHPGYDGAVCWTPGGDSVLFASSRVQMPIQLPNQLWKVSESGTTPERFILPQAINGVFSPDGHSFVFEKNFPWEDEFRNYRGGQNTPLRIFDMKTYEVEKLPWTDTRDINPVWMGKIIYFLSDRDYGMNIWSYDTESKALKQETFFNEFDCKNLKGDDQRMIFENGGYLYTWVPGDGEPQQLHITVTGDFPWARPHWVDADKFVESICLSPSGKRVALSARGEILTVPVDKGSPRYLTNLPASAERAVAWSPDGEHISWFSDASGEYQLVIADQFGNNQRTVTVDEPTFFYHPVWSPDSKYISFYNENRSLLLLNVETGEIAEIDNEGFAHPEHIIYPEWSPDSKWIAYAKRLTNEYGAIFVYSLEQNKSFQLTDGMSDCRMPTWDAGGKYLYFSASTDYGMNVGWLDMSSFDHPVNRGIYLVVLSKDEKSPLAPESDDEEIKKEDEETTVSETKKDKKGKSKGEKEDDEDEDGEEEEVTVKIDFDGIGKRILALPVSVKDYQELQAAEEGVILYSERKPEQKGLTLNRFKLEDEKDEVVVDGIRGFEVSADKSKFLYQTTDNQLVVSSTSGKPKPEDETVSMKGIKVKVDPELEWKQIFREAWRFQRDYFYVDNVHGLDMQWAYDTYSPWVDFVRHRSDLNYILDILGGETSIGHSFVRGGDFPEVDRVPVGLLGADLEVADNHFKIEKIYDGESWNPDVKAPLSQPGLNVKEGQYIVAVNGQPIDASINFYAHFDQTADKQIFLSVNDQPKMDGATEVTVVPVSSEGKLRQLDWVEGNRRMVDSLSNGKLAYVWLPNTSNAGYDNFNRYYFAQKDKKGAVLDERFNQGGSIADYIVDLLARDLLGYFNNPIGDRQPFTAPNAGIWGPKVMIINEMAGSGGDMMPYMFKYRKIGPLVGTTTWGGLVGIWDVPNLIDNGMITAPRGGFYNNDGEWDVENKGVAPDVTMEQTEKEVIGGHDPQLEKAVEVALDLLKTKGVKLKPQPADPVRVLRPSK
ncbi:S41 family peptidase [Mangrovibacterium lignilyticum]|uniref:S41 family peptidase n=1 Tax=Mangrovibacterium lignilyticum TaxID=2668052 RepID=UPI001EE585FC|nr:S41 family peptidase [Mangrovibacterium lignilyticum]